MLSSTSTAPQCQTEMMLARTAPAARGFDWHTFKCLCCDYALKTMTPFSDPMTSEKMSKWLEGQLRALN